MIKPIDPANTHESGYEEEFDEQLTDEIIAENIRTQAPPAPERHDMLVHLAINFFEPGGALSKSDITGRNYEFRPQQMQMAEATAEALKNNHNLCVEAPTGVGKSFAYLVPAVHYSANESKPVVISTETINLQEQLMEKDIPFLRKVLKRDFKAALAKGRSNYICMRRLLMATGELQTEFFPHEASLAEAKRILKWADTTKDGSKSDMPFNVEPSVWFGVCCEGGNCQGPRCSFFRDCFYWNARKAWEEADIIVANHALFFADLKMKDQEANMENTLLPPYSAIIIDEAHTLEDNAAEHLGLRISQAGMTHFIRRLFNPRAGSGLLMKPGQDAIKLRETVAEIEGLTHSFFGLIEGIIDEKDDNIIRVLRPQIVPDLLSDSLATLKKQLEQYIKLQEDKDFRTEMETLYSQCDAYMDGIFKFINMTLEKHVYWIERGNTSEHSTISLHAAPLNISVLLYQCLFSKDFPVIVTSATLSVGQTLDYYRSRVGYGNGSELILDSPFSPDQVKLYIPKAMPDPRDDGYFASVLEQIKIFVEMSNGKAFVLFTNHAMLKSCAEHLEDFFDDLGITLLVQGREMSRSAMLETFKQDIDSVIFGTSSFWTGVDVPGEALSNVIVTKLPFPVPSHPLIEARNERITELGGNPFMHYSLPEAVLKLRQGVGRLIRSKSDTGIIVILDKRIISKRYGSFILDSLPRYQVNIC
jgi:ATP-dependent DNA helicase DinG